jgi:hypothetical protein
VRTVLVSTHFDDAVFSCWSVLEEHEDVTVVTVFSGVPRPGFVTDWDRDTGVDSATRMAQRADENRAALAVAGARAIDVGVLEGMYGGGVVEPADLEPFLSDADVLYVPAGVFLKGSHVEHTLVRDAALTVRPDARLYADQPYCLFRGDVELPEELAGGRTHQRVELDGAARERKAESIRCYAGELDKLEAFFGPCADPDVLREEAFWVA